MTSFRTLSIVEPLRATASSLAELLFQFAHRNMYVFAIQLVVQPNLLSCFQVVLITKTISINLCGTTPLLSIRTPLFSTSRPRISLGGANLQESPIPKPQEDHRSGGIESHDRGTLFKLTLRVLMHIAAGAHPCDGVHGCEYSCSYSIVFRRRSTPLHSTFHILPLRRQTLFLACLHCN